MEGMENVKQKIINFKIFLFKINCFMNRLFEYHLLGKGILAQETVPAKTVVVLMWLVRDGCPGYIFGQKKPEGV
jgi:hypothetical protein